MVVHGMSFGEADELTTSTLKLAHVEWTCVGDIGRVKDHGEWNLTFQMQVMSHVDRLVQEIRNSIANALELLFSCTNPSIYGIQTW